MLLLKNINELKKFTGEIKVNKFRSEKASADGIKFQSVLERDVYLYLKFLKERGKAKYFLMQVPFDLPGRVKYRCDFLVVYSDGRIEYIDAKGFKTKEFIIKHKIVEDIYKVKITLMTRKELERAEWI